MAIRLEPITEGNYIEAFHLQLAEGQEKFVSHPIRSLVQAYIYRNQCQPFGIYSGEKMVGYVMVIYDYDIPEYDIWHMMIDRTYQGCGYAQNALNKCLEYIGMKPFGDSNRVVLTCSKENSAALHIYKKAGFSFTGQQDEEELEMVLYL